MAIKNVSDPEFGVRMVQACDQHPDVHHRIPRSLGGPHTLGNAVVLCPNCHRIEHEQRNFVSAAQMTALILAVLF